MWNVVELVQDESLVGSSPGSKSGTTLKHNTMTNENQTTTTISKWAKPFKGTMLKQVVIHTLVGENKKGKKLYMSQTRHVAV